MKQARVPFQFVTASYLIRICSARATTLGELARNLHSCSDASIFHHTFQSLERHHYAVFANDFAQWIESACNGAALAERLAAIDLRDCTSLATLRESLINKLEAHARENPSAANRTAFEPFYFCEAFELAVTRDERAWNLSELEHGILRMSLQTLHHHFINSRLRLQLKTNDFSHWIEDSLQVPELARRIDGIDIYVNTLQDLRQEIIQTIRRWTAR